MKYFWKTKTGVFFESDKKLAAEQGYDRESDAELTDEQWNSYSNIARLNSKGNIVFGKTEEEIKAEKANQLRSTRDELLDLSDKYMLSDYPIDKESKAKVKAYRQELRDLPQSEEWPDVSMPKFPLEEK